MRTIVFGGVGLPAGCHTWYEAVDGGAHVQVEPGDQIEAEKVVNPEYYVRQAMATWLEPDSEKEI